MADAIPYTIYRDSLGRLNPAVDPTVLTPEEAEIRSAGVSLAGLAHVDAAALVAWVSANPQWVPALGLSVGLSQEKLKNVLKDRFDTSGHVTLARKRPDELVAALDTEFDLVRLLNAQRSATYHFGDVLVARAGTRGAAARAGQSGRRVEDAIEAIARGLGLTYALRTRFMGRNQSAPCDLAIPDGGPSAAIVVAAKGFDSTGSKLSDAVREIVEMSGVRRPDQFVYAVVDGIGWKSRDADLRRIHGLWERREIDGLYTLATLPDFAVEIERAAHLRQLI